MTKKKVLDFFLNCISTVVFISLVRFFILGQVYIDKDLIAVKEGELVSEFTLNEMVSALKYVCSLDDKNIVIGDNGHVVGITLCGSHSDIDKRFRKEYSDKNVVKSILKGIEKVKTENIGGE